MAIEPFETKVYLSSPTMHGDELKYMTEAYETNWMSTIGKNINEVERLTCEQIGCKYAVGLGAGTSALHLAMRYAGTVLYGHPKTGHGTLEGHRVFCTDMTFDATVNPVAYEGGEQIFIDSEYETWNMDPQALERAFTLYPEVRLVVLANLYGTPSQLTEIRSICDEHDAILIEDAAESLGATYRGQQTGSFGQYNAISFNGNKIITGSSGGMFLTDDKNAADMVRKWSTQSREPAPWYQHEDLGYNYRMSNVVAGVVRGQYPYLGEHISQKKAIYMRYKDAFRDLPIQMNPYIEGVMEPNYWLSCMIIDREAMCKQTRTPLEASYDKSVPMYADCSAKIQIDKSAAKTIWNGTLTCPTEILEKIAAINAEGRPIWKPMHMQPIYKGFGFVTANDGHIVDEDIFERGLCLPSDNKMTAEQQERIIEVVRGCF